MRGGSQQLRDVEAALLDRALGGREARDRGAADRRGLVTERSVEVSLHVWQPLVAHRSELDRLPAAHATRDDVELDGRADGDGPGAVGDLRAVEEVARARRRRLDRCRSPGLVELNDRSPRHRRTGQWTILEIGSSMMSVAPASFSAGISVLIVRLRHDGLDRVAAVAEQLRDRRRLHRGQRARSRASRSPRVDVELHQHLAPGLERAREQRLELAPSRGASRDRRRRPGWR